ncbi:transmembrane protein domain-containing protein [Ditylenchus destructor]|uniref:Transmembrane protein 231 n=1 Tax=Ditylenchus destructor TaxID=166010 RepID=A0AAD4NE24_9BILA|nr:transmembrane protein domain-containing protein [Ditylenchus destructor]
MAMPSLVNCRECNGHNSPALLMIVSHRTAIRITEYLLLAIAALAWLCAISGGLQMAPLVVVHNEVVVNSYRAPTLSAAHIWNLLSNVLVVVLSLGLWKKTNTYLEQPIVDFTRKCTFVLRDNSLDPERYLFWTSSQEFNQFGEYAGAAALDTDRLLVPTIETQELDHNEDGRPDELLIGVSLRLPSTSSQHLDVYSIFYALEVKVKLEYRALVQIDGSIIGTTEHLMPGQALNVWGDLHVVQKKPLPSYGLPSTNSTNTTENDGMMSQYDIGLTEYFPMEIQRRNFEKNFSVDLLG